MQTGRQAKSKRELDMLLRTWEAFWGPQGHPRVDDSLRGLSDSAHGILITDSLR